MYIIRLYENDKLKFIKRFNMDITGKFYAKYMESIIKPSITMKVEQTLDEVYTYDYSDKKCYKEIDEVQLFETYVCRGISKQEMVRLGIPFNLVDFGNKNKIKKPVSIKLEEKVYDKNRYDWTIWKNDKPFHIDTPRGRLELKKGSLFGFRPSSSRKGLIRIIKDTEPESHVYSLTQNDFDKMMKLDEELVVQTSLDTAVRDSMFELFSRIICSRDYSHLLHLNSDSGGQHLMLEKIYEILSDMIDDLGEKYFMARNIKIPNPLIKSEKYSTGDLGSLLTEMINLVDKMCKDYDMDESMKSMISGFGEDFERCMGFWRQSQMDNPNSSNTSDK